MQTPSYLWMPLLVVALIRTVLAQALGADPSIQAPAATIQINTTVTVNLFGTLPPFTVDLIEAGTSVVVQVIAPELGFFSVSWNTPSPPLINCFEEYALQITDIIGRTAVSNNFIFTGCPSTETTVTSDFTTTSTFTEESTVTSTFTKQPTVTSTFTETVTESASKPLSCPVSLSVSTVTSTVIGASCPVTVPSFTKVTKVTVLSTETVTKVKTDHDVTTVSTFATRTVTEYAHTTTTTVNLTQTKTKTNVVCETVTTSTTRKGPCHPHY
ncbi:hypothetical protein SEUCBS139899_007063 [Sporothrix eucalyptigena]